MREAVAAGVDALNVDYPRLGADAAGRPVETKLAELAQTASAGAVPARPAAIRGSPAITVFPPKNSSFAGCTIPTIDLARGRGGPGDRPPGDPHAGLHRRASAPEKTARQNAAWAIGISGPPRRLSSVVVT